MRKPILVLVVSSIVLATPAFAQRSTGSIRGTVRDATQSVLPGATVTVVNEETGLSRNVVTNAAGVYSVPVLCGTVLTPAGARSGPAGVAIDVSGGGYTTCSTVYVFLDDLRIGTVHPNAAGVISRGGLSIPGQVAAGDHTVTAACQRSGQQVMTSATFSVTPSGIHRPAIMTALPQPRDVTLDPGRMALSAGTAVASRLTIRTAYAAPRPIRPRRASGEMVRM